MKEKLEERKFINFTQSELDYYNETDFQNRIATASGGFIVNILKYDDGTYLVMFAISIPHYNCKVFPTPQVIKDYVREISPEDYEKYAMEDELHFGNYIIPEDAEVIVKSERRYITIIKKSNGVQSNK